MVDFLSYARAFTMRDPRSSISSAKSPYFCPDTMSKVSPVKDIPSQVNNTKSSPDDSFLSSRFFWRVLRATL